MVIYGKYFGPILNMIFFYSAGKQILFSFNGRKTEVGSYLHFSI